MYEYILLRQDNRGHTEFYRGPMFTASITDELASSICWTTEPSDFIARWTDPADALCWRDWCNQHMPDRMRYKVNCILKGDVI